MYDNGLWVKYETRRGASGATRLPSTEAAAMRALRNPQYVYCELYLDGVLIGRMEYTDDAGRPKEYRAFWLDTDNLA